MFSVISDPLAASATLRVISLVVALCSSTAVAIVPEMSLTWLMTAVMLPIASTAPLGIRLDGVDLVADVFGRLGRLFSEFLDFVGDHGKAFSCLARACGFDGGIQGQQLGLLRDGGDDLDDLADLGAGLTQLRDGDLRTCAVCTARVATVAAS